MNKILLILILCVVSINLFYRYYYPNVSNTRIKEIDNFAYKIDNLSKDSLSFLLDILKEKQIVFLGEQVHNDATTLEIKRELVKLLHEKLGFNVVLYEVGLYDMWMMNNELNDSLYTDLSQIKYNPVYDFWGNNDYCKPLWKYYLKENGDTRTIQLGGFDIQISSSISSEKRSKLLFDYLEGKNIRNKYLALSRLKNDLNLLNISFYNEKLSKETKDSLISELSDIKKEIKVNSKSLEDQIYLRYVDNLKNRYESIWKYNPGSLQSMQIRDSLMAQNLVWLIDSVYSNQKIIIWTANVHSFKKSLPNGFRSLGAYISDKYKNKAYMMGFTSYAKYNNNKGLKDKASSQSIEYLFHHYYKNNYIYINTKDIFRNSFMQDSITSVINQGENIKSNWVQMVDGIFYIDINKDL